MGGVVAGTLVARPFQAVRTGATPIVSWNAGAAGTNKGLYLNLNSNPTIHSGYSMTWNPILAAEIGLVAEADFLAFPYATAAGYLRSNWMCKTSVISNSGGLTFNNQMTTFAAAFNQSEFISISSLSAAGAGSYNCVIGLEISDDGGATTKFTIPIDVTITRT